MTLKTVSVLAAAIVALSAAAPAFADDAKTPATPAPATGSKAGDKTTPVAPGQTTPAPQPSQPAQPGK